MLKCFLLDYNILPTYDVFPTVTWVTSSLSVDGLVFFVLLLTTVLPLKRSLRFFVLLNDVIGMFSNAFPIISFIWKMGQCFFIILDIFGAVRLYIVTSSIRFSFLEIFE